MAATDELDAVQFADDESDLTSGGEGGNCATGEAAGASWKERLRDWRRRAVRLKRRTNRKWNPYQKFNASRQRRETQPLAPYNTTQFLMNDHELEYEDELKNELESRPARERRRDASFSCDDEESVGFYYSSPSDEEDFVNEDFAKQYGHFRAERLGEMTKADLVFECMEFNRRIEILEDQVRDMRKGEIPMSREEAEKIHVIQREIGLVGGENVRLRRALRDLCVARREKVQRRVDAANAIAPKMDKNSGVNSSNDSGVESNSADELTIETRS